MGAINDGGPGEDPGRTRGQSEYGIRVVDRGKEKGKSNRNHPSTGSIPSKPCCDRAALIVPVEYHKHGHGYFIFPYFGTAVGILI